jgi:transposase
VEYLERHPEGYRYTQYCEHYKQWKKRQGATMRQVHRAGEKMFVDYAGKKPRIIDHETGEVTEVELFVAVLGASNYTYVEATHTQSSQDWIGSHARAFEFFGGVAASVVPDQLKSGVTEACRYEPGLQRTYSECLAHYGTAGIPARPGKPRDKAKVETAVLVAERWILARLRNQTFFSLTELNRQIAELVTDLNARVMKHYGVSRRQLFDQLERAALRPLPMQRFVYGEWHFVKLNIDYHFVLDHHFYSAPHPLIAEKLEVRMTAATVEIFLRGRRIDSHVRSYRRGAFTTKPEHMPKIHREHAEWTPSRMIRWANKIGPETTALVSAILRDRPHPEQGYRSCLGILRLEKLYGRERLEAASARAVAVGARSYKHVAAILKHRLERTPLPSARSAVNANSVAHENVRGPSYYQQGNENDE